MECGELVDLIDAADRLAGRPAVMATVVDVDGSSYRRPGARMLVALDDHDRVGLVSGGCLERDLARRAGLLTASGPSVVCYDTRGTEERPHGLFGSGCDGVVHILLQRLADAAPTLDVLRRVLDAGEPETLRTVYRGDGVGGVLTDGPAAEDRPVSHRVELGGGRFREVLVERVEPPRRVTLLGGGDDVRPLVGLGATLGWDTLVVTPRPAGAGRFEPAAVAHAAATDVPALLAGRGRLGRSAAVVLMSHDFDHDVAVLPALLASEVGYVGLLGPKRRAGRLMAALHAVGRLPSPASLGRLHTPVGLDLGAGGPREVALAVAAQVVASFNGRAGGPLAERAGPIHEPARHAVAEGAAV